MKLITFFILLMFMPEFAMAQEFSSEVNTSSNMNEQAAVPLLTTDRSHRHIANGANNSLIELNALSFMEELDLCPSRVSFRKQNKLMARSME